MGAFDQSAKSANDRALTTITPQNRVAHFEPKLPPPPLPTAANARTRLQAQSVPHHPAHLSSLSAGEPLDPFPGDGRDPYGRGAITDGVEWLIDNVAAGPDTVWVANMSIRVSDDASGSTDDVGIESYNWSFVEGIRTPATSPTITHTFSSAGSWQVTLNVRDTAGQTASTSQTIEVGSS